MIIGTRASVVGLLMWQWKTVVFALSVSGVAVAAHKLAGWDWLALPSFPLAIVGAALGIFVSFRTNSSYDRWWEGRKLWGRMINVSRHIAIQANAYLGNERAQPIVRRHIGYVHAFRCVLRDQAPGEDESVQQYLAAELGELEGSSTITSRLLELQMRDLSALQDSGVFDSDRMRSFDESLREIIGVQGGCERIKKTPLPRIYSFMSERMIQWFGGLLPLGLVGDLGWGTIPITMMVLLGFKLISETGRVLEDPFSLFWNGLPLSYMSRMIEINLLEILGEKDLPEPVQPKPPFVLM